MFLIFLNNNPYLQIAVENFDEIIKLVNGVLIARGYLTVHIPVERLMFKVRQMIKKCHEQFIPVMVSCNILESMISSLLPTIPEIGEISNLTNEYIDGFILSAETTYGDYPIESIETLSRSCLEVEREQVQNYQDHPQKSVYIETRSQKHKILNTIVFSVIEAAYKLSAKLIISFTNTGSSALRLSKLRPPCPIISICNQILLARMLNYLSGVSGRYFPSMYGQENIIKKVIDRCKQQKIVVPGDFVIITFTAQGSSFNTTDTMKIQQVE